MRKCRFCGTRRAMPPGKRPHSGPMLRDVVQMPNLQGVVDVTECEPNHGDHGPQGQLVSTRAGGKNADAERVRMPIPPRSYVFSAFLGLT